MLAAAALVAALATAAVAYLPPAGAILRRAAQRRADAFPSPVEARGTVTFFGEAARQAAAAARLPLQGPELASPAVVLLKAPSRCRLELAPEGVPPPERAAVSLKGARLSGQRGLERTAPARALVEGLCALLGEKGSAEALASELRRRGVNPSEVSLGRTDHRIAWVLGGRPREPTPQVWVDRQLSQPTRLIAPLAGATRDVRLIGLGTGPGGDAFPQTIEVRSGEQLELRFTADKVARNPKMADALF